jgi:hypothetical protein
MSNEQKGIGQKLKRLFVEEGDAGAEAASAADAVAAIAQQMNAQQPAHAPPLPAQSASPRTEPARAALTGIEPAKIEFSSIYRTAGISDEDLEQAGRAEKLLHTLPASLPLETQRQILEGALKTFGVDPARIRQSVQRQQRALAAYAQVSRQDVEKRDAEGRARIEALRAEALKLERAAEERARAQASLELACKNQSEAVSRLTDFLPLPPAAPEKP